MSGKPLTTVFYAWQSDTDGKINRYLIRDALDGAVTDSHKLTAIEDAPRLKIDHDTKGEPGTPHIADTILRKIDGCALFVADLTFVGRTATRIVHGRKRFKRLPNPNVLFELGYAAKSIGWERIILVMNSAFGSPERLPFDLKYRSFPLTFELKDRTDSSAIKAAGVQLRKAFAEKIKTIVDNGVLARAEEDRRLAERKVVVSCKWGITRHHGQTLRLFMLKASNDGARPVLITNVYFRLTTRCGIFPSTLVSPFPWPLPKKLEDGESVEVLWDRALMLETMNDEWTKNPETELASLHFDDAIGNEYTLKLDSEFTQALRDDAKTFKGF